jgi:hypothetical protein
MIDIAVMVHRRLQEVRRLRSGGESVTIGRVTFGQFAASLFFGILSVLLPLTLFVGTVAILVYVARWWLDRPRS